jgi:diguanylate cyclase (GGDEF)-like protein
VQGFFRSIVFLALVAATPAPAAQWDRLRTAVFTHLGREQGMPHPNVSALLQDADGFVWVGTTQGGLARFDGHRFKSFVHREGDPSSLPGDFILALSVDGKGRVWTGTASGDVAYYDKDSDSFRSFPEPAGVPARGSGLKLAGDGDGVWVASSNTGLERIDVASGAITHYSHRDGDPASLPSDRVRSLFLDRGDLWVGTYWGLVRRPAGQAGFEPVPIVGGSGRPFEDMVVGMTTAGDGHVWFVTAQSGIGRIEPAGEDDPHKVGRILAGQSAEVAAGPLSLALTEAKPGEMWVSRVSGGIAAIDMATGRTRLIQHDPRQPQSLADDTVRGLIRDRSGLVWAGTNHGLCWTDPRTMVVDTVLPSALQPGGLADGDVFGVAATPDGRAWLGTKEHGVVALDPARGTLAAIPGAAQIAADGIVDSLSTGPDGALWIAAGNGRALFRYDPVSTLLTRHAFPRVNNEARRILAQVWAEGSLWLAAGGLVRYDPASDSFRTYRHGLDLGTLVDDSANAIQLSAPGSLWVGTQRGLDRLDIESGRFRHLAYDPADPESLPGNYISAILTDRRGRLWVGTASGIGVADRASDEIPRFRRIGTGQGLPNNNIDAMQEDGAGRVWVSTADGLAVIDPDALTARPLGAGGAAGGAISAYWINSAAGLPDGTLLFGGLGGLSVVHPDRLQEWNFHPPVLLTDLRVDGRPAPGRAGGGILLLGPGDSSFEAEFAALDYSAPDRLRYAYRLEGFDRDWIPSDAQRRTAAYTNLPPGRYRLLVKGSNRDGVWSDTMVLPVEVLPFWWQAWWFRVLGVLFTVLSVIIVVQVRTAVLRRRREDLERLVAAQTRDLTDANRRLGELAARDALTGLFNRRHFLEFAERELERARRMGRKTSVLLIDIDHFKRVNDQHGHEAGDDVLRGVCARLAAGVRDADLLARLGGEELGVLAPETDIAAALVVAERLRQSVAGGPYTAGDAKLLITVSIGVATIEDPGEALKSLMGRADKALYVAKAGGRNRVVEAAPLA